MPSLFLLLQKCYPKMNNVETMETDEWQFRTKPLSTFALQVLFLTQRGTVSSEIIFCPTAHSQRKQFQWDEGRKQEKVCLYTSGWVHSFPPPPVWPLSSKWPDFSSPPVVIQSTAHTQTKNKTTDRRLFYNIRSLSKHSIQNWKGIQKAQKKKNQKHFRRVYLEDMYLETGVAGGSTSFSLSSPLPGPAQPLTCFQFCIWQLLQKVAITLTQA